MVAYVDDPVYLDRQGYVSPNNQVPPIDDTDMVTTGYCHTHNLYDAWTFKVPLQKGPRFYTTSEYDPYICKHYNIDNAPDVANDRQTFKGMLLFTGNMGSVFANNTPFGDLYFTYTIEFSDIGSVPTQGVGDSPSFTLDEKRTMKLIDKMKQLELKQKRSSELKSILKKEQQEIKSFPSIHTVEHKVDPSSLYNMVAVVDAQEAAPGPVHELVFSDRDSEDGLVTVQRD